MKYSLLGQDLHDAADRAKTWFANQYGARKFISEQEVTPDLPLRPTWQATLRTGYMLCLNVQPTPFSPTLHEFVNQCAQKGLPVKLWVAVPPGPSKESFSADLKQARNAGVGVIQVPDDRTPHEYHRAVPLSLFALARTDQAKVPKARREVLKNAEDTFLDGTPDMGCQAICQELELITKQFAQLTYNRGWWKAPKGKTQKLQPKYFTKGPWATMLQGMEQRADVSAVCSKSPEFKKQLVVRTRAFTDWRNDVSHKPKTISQLKARDARLRTMFEATRDLLVDWYRVSRPLGLIK